MSSWFVELDYCDFCANTVEYGTIPHCRDCGERTCPACMRPHSWRESDEGRRPSCICIHCDPDVPEIEELITDVDFD